MDAVASTTTNPTSPSPLATRSKTSSNSVPHPQACLKQEPSSIPIKNRRSRRTKAQAEAARVEAARKKEEAARQKEEQAQLKRPQKATAGPPPPKKTTTLKSKSQTDNDDSNLPFVYKDFQNVCSYLENEANFTRLYRDKKTVVGGSHLTKGAAYDVFAIYINTRSDKRLNLTGKQL
ncbi:hypothetical protein Pst134EB_021925 [Puccinia striiformis f. sp. tritici]|nr:hypothetical protein Pst134EB_021925 [Puccinia striiformis f. sp. tritici]